MTPRDGSRTKLDAKTWVPIGLLTGILGAAVVGTASAVGFFKDITNAQDELVRSTQETTEAVRTQGAAIQNLSDDMYRVRIDLNTSLSDRWRNTDMTFWVLSAQQALDRAGFKVQLPPAQPVSRDGTGGQLK